jgi:hypothetical protein
MATLKWTYADTNPLAYSNPLRWSNKKPVGEALDEILKENPDFKRPVHVKFYDGAAGKEAFQVTSRQEFYEKCHVGGGAAPTPMDHHLTKPAADLLKGKTDGAAAAPAPKATPSRFGFGGGGGRTAAAPPSKPKPGAYLVFNPTSNGTMSIVWSEEPVAKALAYGAPGKEVPKFKFAGTGTSELRKNLQSDKDMYYGAWGLFVKECAQYDCSITDLDSTSAAGIPDMPCSLWFHYAKDNEVKKLRPNTPCSLGGVDCIVAAHSSTTEFATNLSRTQFLQKTQTGKVTGYCVSLGAGGAGGTTCCAGACFR